MEHAPFDHTALSRAGLASALGAYERINRRLTFFGKSNGGFAMEGGASLSGAKID